MTYRGIDAGSYMISYRSIYLCRQISILSSILSNRFPVGMYRTSTRFPKDIRVDIIVTDLSRLTKDITAAHERSSLE